jgi:hypothetical protein
MTRKSVTCTRSTLDRRPSTPGANDRLPCGPHRHVGLLFEPLGSDLVMLGRWQRILIDALDESEAVGVQATVDRHLGRQATGRELSCARRAGHILADRGLAETVLVFGPRTNGGRESRSLVL